jgi:EmrB/QacA subfamily drug resistance transporter
MTKSERTVLVAAIIGSSMTFVDGTVVNVVLPVLRERLGATLAQAQWIVEAYMLLLSSLMLVGGALGDRWGRRFVFTLGILTFTAASVLCGLSMDANQLVAARALQGMGAALLVPGSLALISASFDKRSIGTWAGFTSIAAGAGPILGGWLVEHLSWRWIFFINVPPAVAVIVSLRHVSESRDDRSIPGVDWPGALLATAGLFALVFGLIEGGSGGFGRTPVWASLAAGAAALVAFAVVEMRSKNPMMPPDLFRSRTFTGANLLTLFLYCALGATLFVLPFNLIEVQKYSTVEAAAALSPFVIVMFVLSRWAGGLMDRYGAKLPLTVGPVIAAAGFLLFTRVASRGSYLTTVLPAVLCMSVGMATTVAPLTTAVMTSADERRAGIASGTNNAVSRVASLLAVAIVGPLVRDSFENGLSRVAWLSAGLALAGAACAVLLVEPSSRTAAPVRA